jgi:hypothetical protein
MTEPTAVSTAATSAKALKENAKRLGLQWGLRPGTVSVTGATPQVKLDGDTDTNHQVVDLTSSTLAVGTRIMTLMLPDSMYIVGFPGGAKNLNPGVYSNQAAAGPIGTTETVTDTTPSALNFAAGRAFKVNVGWWHTASVANQGIIRLRRGTTTGGTVLGVNRFNANTGSAIRSNDVMFFRNSTGTAVADKISLTLIASTGTITLSASTDTPRYMVFTDAGSADDYADWPSL